MAIFEYKAKRGPEDILEGKMIADTSDEVVERLNEKGYVALSVKEKGMQEGEPGPLIKRQSARLSLKEKIFFSRQLASLLKSGIPILKALQILSEQTSNKKFSVCVDNMANDIKNGETLSSSLGNYSKIFSPFYLAMVKAGEDSGEVDTSLFRVTDYYLKQAEFNSKIKTALAYPILILVVGFFTVLFMFTNVIPKIIPLFSDLGAELPLPTKILISTSDFIRNHWFNLSLFIIIFLVIVFRVSKNKLLNAYFSMIRLKTPVLGDFILKAEFARFARAMEMALHDGIPIIKAMDISIPIIGEEIIKEELLRSRDELEKGSSLGEVLKLSRVFPPFVFNLISVGEESGKVEESFTNIAESYESECSDALKIMTTLIEPIMVLGVGLVVAFIVSAVLLPIFQLNFVTQ